MPGTTRRSRHDEAAEPVIPPASSTIDLHTHTRRSDGILEPVALVAAAAAAGVRLLALTDHDTLAGYREVRGAANTPAGLELIAGVEINALVRDHPSLWESEVHVLGLGVDADDDAFESVLAVQRGSRRVRFDRMLARLRELDLGVDDALESDRDGSDDSVGRPTVARALVAKGHATNVEDAFRRWLGWGAPAYVPRDGLGPLDAIRVIRAAGGVPVLAHFSEAPTRRAVLGELIDGGLAGLEVYYRTFDRSTVTAMEVVARELRLVPTGGSDYHGDTGTYAEAHAGLWVPPECGPLVHEVIAKAHGLAKRRATRRTMARP